MLACLSDSLGFRLCDVQLANFAFGTLSVGNRDLYLQINWSGKLLCFTAFTELYFKRTLNFIYIFKKKKKTAKLLIVWNL